MSSSSSPISSDAAPSDDENVPSKSKHGKKHRKKVKAPIFSGLDGDQGYEFAASVRTFRPAVKGNAVAELVSILSDFVQRLLLIHGGHRRIFYHPNYTTSLRTCML